MRIKRRMTATEFEAVSPFLNISEKREKAARAALVDGETLQAVGDRLGCTRQAVCDAVNVVWEKLARWRESQQAASVTLLPPGWEQVTLIAPSNLIPKFREEIAKSVAYPSNPPEKVAKKPKDE